MKQFLTSALVALAATSSLARADGGWTAVNLHPVGAGPNTYSEVRGVTPAMQVGSFGTSGSGSQAGYWSGTGSSWTSLHPGSGFMSSQINGSDGMNHVGSVQPNGTAYYRATLWTMSGSSYTRVDLNPTGSIDSSASSISGSQQVGVAAVGGVYGASLWSGTAESWTNLNPTGSSYSWALATNGIQQGGFAEFALPSGGKARYGGIWSGTAASWTNLNPTGAVESQINAIAGGMQGGYAKFDGLSRAGLWSGTAASWVDLGPAGSLSSRVLGMTDTLQVGHAMVNGKMCASVWSGSAASWVDLSVAIPTSFSSSYAQTVWTDGITTIIGGYGYNTATNRSEALLWTQVVPSPGAFALIGLAGLVGARRRR